MVTSEAHHVQFTSFGVGTGLICSLSFMVIWMLLETWNVHLPVSVSFVPSFLWCFSWTSDHLCLESLLWVLHPSLVSLCVPLGAFHVTSFQRTITLIDVWRAVHSRDTKCTSINHSFLSPSPLLLKGRKVCEKQRKTHRGMRTSDGGWREWEKDREKTRGGSKGTKCHPHEKTDSSHGLILRLKPSLVLLQEEKRGTKRRRERHPHTSLSPSFPS